MEHRILGTTGIDVSPIVAGGWQAGRQDWVGIDDSQSIASFRASYDGGVTTFDTAEEYGNGHSERILKKALGHVRDNIVIATKASWRNLRSKEVVRACERSLVNLGTDHIDLYQIHWPAGSFGSETVPLEETVEGLVRLQRAGKVRALGVSNFDRDQLERALALTRIDAIQVPHSLFWRKAESDSIPLAVRNSISVMAYSPLAQGLLSGKFGSGNSLLSGDNRTDNRLFHGENRTRVDAALADLRRISKELGITMSQLALSWLISQPFLAVVGARTEHQAAENASAGSISLPAEILDEVTKIGRAVTDPMTDDSIMWDWKV